MSLSFIHNQKNKTKQKMRTKSKTSFLFVFMENKFAALYVTLFIKVFDSTNTQCLSPCVHNKFAPRVSISLRICLFEIPCISTNTKWYNIFLQKTTLSFPASLVKAEKNKFAENCPLFGRQIRRVVSLSFIHKK